jgi:protein-S-isoprenylcysteine O-methyltransferase Ste14
MRRMTAAGGSALFFAVAPGLVAGLGPWALTGWHAREAPQWWLPVRIFGGLVTALGVVVLAGAFVRFVSEGSGTPAPVAPTERLVIGGLYRYVRNPMYLAVTATVLGQAALLAQPVLVGYAAVVGALMVAFVRCYEEPGLTRRYGTAYEAYRRAVPGWWPRARPWRP